MHSVLRVGDERIIEASRVSSLGINLPVRVRPILTPFFSLCASRARYIEKDKRRIVKPERGSLPVAIAAKSSSLQQSRTLPVTLFVFPRRGWLRVTGQEKRSRICFVLIRVWNWKESRKAR